MAPTAAGEVGGPAAEKRCPVSGKAGLCPMMAKAMAAGAAAAQPIAAAVAAAPSPPAAVAGEELRSLIRMGTEHLLKGDHVPALKAFSRATDADPGDEEAVCGKVAALRRLGRPRGALKACEAGLVALPACAWLLGTREELRAELSDDEEAAPAAEEAAPEEGGGCPASRDARRDAEALRRRPRRSAGMEVALPRLDTEESVPFRQALREELITFYRDFYHRYSTKNVDTSQYTKDEKRGLSITDGHRHIPRPESVDVPDDWQQPVGVLSPEELAEYNCSNPRLLLCVHGDIFDVSDRPDKYGPDAPYNTMSGHDITWALWSGYDDEAEWDKYYDLYQAKPREERDKRLQGLMSWWAFFEEEYGDPVGRLSVYEREWELAPPPAVKELCTVM